MARSAAIVAIIITLAGVAGCVSSRTNRCGELICPEGTACVPTLGQCFSDDSVAVCRGRADGAPCTGVGIVEGYCRLGVCVDTQCGDGIVSGSEDCEGDDVGAASCGDLDFYGGDLTCGIDCRFNVTDCVGFCGDGRTNGPEECDGNDLPPISCLDFGFDSGKIGCSSICSTSFAGCERFGWKILDSQSANYFDDMFGAAPDSIDGVGRNGLFKHWDGAAWSTVDLGTALSWRGIGGSAADNVWAVGDGGQVARQDGTGWAMVDLGDADGADVKLYDVATRAPNDVWIVGENATVLHYDGAAWSPVDIGATATDRLRTIEISGAVIAIGGRDVSTFTNRLYVNNNGAGWVELLAAFPSSGSVRDIEIGAADDIWVAGKWSMPKHWDGSQWTNQVFPNVNNCFDVHRRAADDIFIACGGTGRPIFHFDGDGWVTLDYGHFGTARRLLSFGDRWLAAGARGATAEFRGRGYVRHSEPATVVSISGVSAGRRDRVLVSHSQGVAVFDGLAWTDHPTGEFMRTVVATGPDTAWAVGSNTNLYLYDNGALTLSGAAPIGFATRSSASGPDNVWLSGSELARFDGQAWSAVASPMSSIFALLALGADQAWLGGLNGQVQRFDGQGWGAVAGLESVAGAHVFALGGTSATDVWAGTPVGLFRFNGVGWSQIDEMPDTNANYRWIQALAPDDVYVEVLAGNDRLYHFDGLEWTRIRTRIAQVSFGAATADSLVVAGGSDVDMLVDVR